MSGSENNIKNKYNIKDLVSKMPESYSPNEDVTLRTKVQAEAKAKEEKKILNPLILHLTQPSPQPFRCVR